MEQIIKTVRETIGQHRLLSGGDTVIIGVSGGPDSVGLTVLLDRLNRYYGHKWQLVIAHLNHQIRGKAADADERFVRQLAAKLGLPFYSSKRDIPALSQRHKLSLEETARNERYEFLSRLAGKLKHNKRVPKIATGHTLDDQAETVLFRIIRGTGIKGLRGILPARNLLPGRPFRLIRPLIELTHKDITDFLKAHGFGYRSDKSNFDRKILRNRIRHQLMPLLNDYNPGVARHLVQLGQAAGEYEAVVSKLAETLCPKGRKWLSLAELRNQPQPVQQMMINHLLKNAGCNLKHIVRANYEALIGLASSCRKTNEVHLSGGVIGRIANGRLTITKKT
ncbi:MAG: tRNA lysidine(34) synthetase TilS [Candidatus Brocadiia bacterium]